MFSEINPGQIRIHKKHTHTHMDLNESFETINGLQLFVYTYQKANTELECNMLL